MNAYVSIVLSAGAVVLGEAWAAIVESVRLGYRPSELSRGAHSVVVTELLCGSLPRPCTGWWRYGASVNERRLRFWELRLARVP